MNTQVVSKKSSFRAKTGKINGNWNVDNIEQSDMAIDYAKMTNIVPVESQVKVNSLPTP